MADTSKNVLVRTVTYHYLGRISDETELELRLDVASWLADSGRLGKAVREGIDTSAEVEFLGDGIRLMRGAIVDVIPYPHALPTKDQ